MVPFRKKRAGYRKKRDWSIVRRSLRHRWMVTIMKLFGTYRRKMRFVNYKRALRLETNAYMAHYAIDRRVHHED